MHIHVLHGSHWKFQGEGGLDSQIFKEKNKA